MKYILFFCVGLLLACGGKVEIAPKAVKVITDLPFEKAQSAKEYADVVLKAIKTNRNGPLQAQFVDPDKIDAIRFKEIITMYSSGIGGREDWEYIDLLETSNASDPNGGFDYAWLDPKGRLGLQIYIEPKKTEKGFELNNLEFRSRIDILETIAFPKAEIEDYKKLEFNWDEIEKRRLARVPKK